jgi:hypothetical protein
VRRPRAAEPRPPGAAAPPTFAEFEAAVFDAATRFTTFTHWGRGWSERVDHGADLAAAFARSDADARTVVYAVAPSGRSIVLDRAERERWLAVYNARKR